MGLTDWGISIGLIILVLRQIRGKQLTPASLLWPVALVGWAAFEYLGAIPAYRSDWGFALALAAIGLVLGIGCGLLTSVYPEGGKVMARATSGAAVLWVLGMVSRLAFGVVALHGGAAAIGVPMKGTHRMSAASTPQSSGAGTPMAKRAALVTRP